MTVTETIVYFQKEDQPRDEVLYLRINKLFFTLTNFYNGTWYRTEKKISVDKSIPNDY